MELIPGLPEEMGLECLVRLPPASHRSARGVGRQWKELIESPEFYRERKRTGNTRHIACFIQAIHHHHHHNNKPATGLLAYGITLFDPSNKSNNNKWARLEPIPNRSGALPIFCQLAGVDGELVVMGGWDPDTWESLRDVWVYSFTAGRWRRGREMPVARSAFAAAGGADGKVYVAGGHDEERNVLCSAAYYDVKGDEWVEMAPMTEGRDECEGVMVGDDQFWVVGGFGPGEPGRFVGSAEVYDMRLGRWRRVEGVWPEGRRPRGCVGVKEGERRRLVCWGEAVAAVRVGTCGVRIGERVMVAGMDSAAPGAPASFYMIPSPPAAGEEDNDGTDNSNSKRVERVYPAVEFSGFVQSGCCVEI